MSVTTLDRATRLMTFWATPPADDAAALAEIRALYTDPVDLNGSSTTALDLLARVRSMQQTFSGLHHELLDRADTPDRLVIAFRLRGVHTGPLATPLGTVAATGRAFETRVIDILTLTGDRISRVVMVGDELGLLTGLGALRLTPPPAGPVPDEERAMGVDTGPRVGQFATRSRLVTRRDIVLFTELSGDRNPLHYDEEMAAGTSFGGIVVQGGVISALLNGVVAEDLPGPGSVFLQLDLRFRAPVRPGDVITAHVGVTSARTDERITGLEVLVTRDDGVTAVEGTALCYTFALTRLG